MHIQTSLLFVLCLFCNYLVFAAILSHKKMDINIKHHKHLNDLPLKSAVGPESIAYDCKGQGPYTGVSDGRVLKWQGRKKGWRNFAFTSPNWNKEICNKSEDYTMEPTCGRPLGLRFNNKTCRLYIADAYYGLMVVGPNGGKAKSLVTSAAGGPLKFTNALDINQRNGVIYFTDSSTRYQRRDYIWAILNGDSTGRLMQYNPKTKNVTVLLNNLTFANGVALSKNNDFLLVAETTTARIIRYWLKGPKARTHEMFSRLQGMPDNIRRNGGGDFWVAITVDVETTLQSTAIKFDENAKVLKEVTDFGDIFHTITEAYERRGTLVLGSLSMSHVGLYKL